MKQWKPWRNSMVT